MRTGDLNKRVVLQQASEGTADTLNEKPVTWSDVATLWAGVMPQSSREFYRAQQIHPTMSHLVVIRYRGTVTPAMRFKFGSDRYLYIEGVMTVDERQHEMQLVCAEATD